MAREFDEIPELVYYENLAKLHDVPEFTVEDFLKKIDIVDHEKDMVVEDAIDLINKYLSDELPNALPKLKKYQEKD